MFKIKEAAAQMALLHYPPQDMTDEANKRVLGIGAHTE